MRAITPNTTIIDAKETTSFVRELARRVNRADPKTTTIDHIRPAAEPMKNPLGSQSFP